jgi:hypothetical protein
MLNFPKFDAAIKYIILLSFCAACQGWRAGGSRRSGKEKYRPAKPDFSGRKMDGNKKGGLAVCAPAPSPAQMGSKRREAVRKSAANLSGVTPLLKAHHLKSREFSRAAADTREKPRRCTSHQRQEKNCQLSFICVFPFSEK